MKRKTDDEILNEGILDAELAAEEEEIKSRKFKYGTMATIFTVVFIAAVVLIWLVYLVSKRRKAASLRPPTI